MDFMQIYSLANDVIGMTDSNLQLVERGLEKVNKFDQRYLDPKYWVKTIKGPKSNGWIRLYNGEDDASNFANIDNVANTPTDILLNNIVINISRSPTIIETKMKGLDSSVKQFWDLNDYNINITGKIPGPFFWQHDSKLIKNFLKMLNSNEPLGIVSPELELLGYDIKKVVVYNYNLNQDARFYQSKIFSLQLKSDDPDISLFTDKNGY